MERLGARSKTTDRKSGVASRFVSDTYLKAIGNSSTPQHYRSLEEKVLYKYDRRIYSESAVVLNVTNENCDLSIFISISKEIDGWRNPRILKSNDLGNHWISLDKLDMPIQAAEIYGGAAFARGRGAWLSNFGCAGWSHRAAVRF